LRLGHYKSDGHEVNQCPFDESGERDSKGWHTASNTKLPTYDAKCTEAAYVIDVNTLKDVGNHKFEDLVKGCGEPEEKP
jgi:hypothetical protein